jgi:hypothetical protein
LIIISKCRYARCEDLGEKMPLRKTLLGLNEGMIDLSCS